MANWKLLVEGKDDQDFFNTFCTLVIGANKIDVFPPKSLDDNSGDGWANLIKNLPILLGQLKNGDIEKLGIIIDADFPPDNSGGFSSRFNLVVTKLKAAGYKIPIKPTFTSGELLKHPDGLPNVGFWVMPNHKDDGMLEHFIESMIVEATQLSLLQHAEKAIQQLPTMLFDKRLRSIKAKIFSWRAWQKRPGLPLNKALNEGVLDRSKAANFEAWLSKTFS